MRKKMTSEELRARGYPELALYQEPAKTSPKTVSADPEKAAAEPPRVLAEAEPDEELKRLLGSLVSPLLRDAEGKLDVAKIRAGNFEEFRQCLRDQVSVDGIAFNQHLLASYHKVLGKEEHEPLLRLLWEGREEDKMAALPPGALKSLTADLIAVSAERFVSSHLNDREGRRRLRGILVDSAQYSREIRTDLSKAIASVGERQGIGGLYSHQSEKQISSWNYFNWDVTDTELREAGRLAEEILSVADEQEAHIQKSRARYREHPEKVRALVTKDRTISVEEIRRFAALEAVHRDKPDPLSQLRARLAGLWLLAADSENWREENAYGSSGNRSYLLAESERLFSLTENVHDEAGLRWLNDQVQDFLDAPLPETGAEPNALKEAFAWLEHKVVGRGLEELFEAVPEGHKGAYLQLKQLSDTWKHAVDMGETLLPEISPLENKVERGESAQVWRAANQLSLELHKTKHQFWYHYKQHKALSRGASNVASWFGGGDIEDIREANRWIDKCLHRLAKVRTREELEKELKALYGEIKKGGKLFAAMEAAEMEGIEQLIGLIQTVAEIAAITLVTEGMGTAGAIANAARAGRAVQGALQTARGAAQGADTLSWAAKTQYGMKMGMAISATENAMAVGTGEVRERPETLLAWGKDSLTTGAAMSLFGPVAMGGASASVSRNLGTHLLQRYAGQGAKGLGHLAKDTAAETGEELFDAQLRQGLDGKHQALGPDQIREITLVSGFGGAQMGALNRGFRVFQQQAESEAPRSSLDRANLPTTWEISSTVVDREPPQPSPSPWRQLLLTPMWMFLSAGGPGGFPPGPGKKSPGHSATPSEAEVHARRLAAIHTQLEPVFAKAGQALTLRDLLLAGEVTLEMSLKLKLLSMEESLRIVYADRYADGETSESIRELIRKGLEQKPLGPSGANTGLREKIRLILNNILNDPEVTNLRGVYEALAELEGMTLFSWLPRVLRHLSRGELDEVLDQISGTSSEEAFWILRSKNPAGGPRLKKMYLKAAREGDMDELDIFAGEEWDLANCLREWGLVDEEVIQEFRKGLFHHQELNRSHYIWALPGLSYWEKDFRDPLLEILEEEDGYVENIDEAAHYTLKVLAFRDQVVAERLGYSGPVEAYWHSRKSRDGGQSEAALEIYKQLDWNEKKMIRSGWMSRLESRDETERQEAVAAIRDLGESSPELRLALLKRLEDESAGVRFAATKALVSLGLVDEAIKRNVEQVLAQGLGDKRERTKVNCAAAIRKLGLGGEGIKATLLEWLRDEKDSYLKESTADALREWGLAEEEFRPALLENLKDSSGPVHHAAASALDRLFPEWDSELSAVPKIVFEELIRTPKQADQENKQGVKGLAAGLPQWPGTGSNDSSRWQAYIPERQKIFMGRSTTRALQGLVAGIRTQTPVYLTGETGTGKNAILRYLAHITGTPLLRINFNRETDDSQLYGHFAIESDEQGKRRVVLHDGKMIQAMKHGAWVVWDEANLAPEAFLVAQNDLIQQIQSGKVTVRQGGKLVTINVHPHFRLFATGNPEGYAGRKATERSFGNRWLKLFVKPMTVEEQQAFLATEYQDLSPESAEVIPSILHALKLVLGGEKITIRTLKRVAGRIQEMESGSLWERKDGGASPQLMPQGMRAYLSAIEAEVLDGLNGDDYQNAVQTLAQALPRGAYEIKDYVSQPPSREEFEAKVGEYAGLLDRGGQEKNPGREQGEDREESEPQDSEARDWGEFVPVPTFLKYAAKALDSLIRSDHLLIEGPPATSKSSFMRLIGRDAGQEVIEVTGSSDHSTAEMIGMPSLDEQGNLVFQEGYFLRALKEGAILVVNEANLIPAEVLERLNSVFDDDKMIVVSENGHEAPVKAHPNFRLVLTQNPAGMNGGRKRHSPALENKFRKIYIREAFSPEELTLIARQNFPALAPAAEKMARFHQEAARVFADGGSNRTLRDLLQWGLIATRLMESQTLPPQEALPLGAELVYLRRGPDGDRQDSLQAGISHLELQLAKIKFQQVASDETSPLTQTLRHRLRDILKDLGEFGEFHLDPIYRDLAEQEGLSLGIWLSRILRGLSPEDFKEILSTIGAIGGAYKNIREGEGYLAIQWLSHSKNPAASDLLLELLDIHQENSSPIVEVFGTLGVANEKVQWRLIDCLHENSLVSVYAAKVLGELRFQNEPVRKNLRLALNNGDIRVRMRAAQSLEKLGFADDALRDFYLDALRNPKFSPVAPPMTLEAAEGLLRIKRGAVKEARNFLLKIFHTSFEGSNKKERAAAALIRGGSRNASFKNYLIKQFSRGSVNEQLNVAEILADLGIHRKEVKRKLLQLWEEKHPDCWPDRIAKILACLGQADKAVKKTLMENLRRGSWDAAGALDQLFPGWDQEIHANFRKHCKILSQELSQRLSDIEGQQKNKIESLLQVLPKWEAPALQREASSDEARTAALRAEIREILRDEAVSHPRQIYERFAAREGMALEIWLSRVLKSSDRAAIRKLLDGLETNFIYLKGDPETWQENALKAYETVLPDWRNSWKWPSDFAGSFRRSVEAILTEKECHDLGISLIGKKAFSFVHELLRIGMDSEKIKKILFLFLDSQQNLQPWSIPEVRLIMLDGFARMKRVDPDITAFILEGLKSTDSREVREAVMAAVSLKLSPPEVKQALPKVKQALLEYLNGPTHPEKQAADLLLWVAAADLDKLFPGWDREMVANYPIAQIKEMIESELSRKPSNAGAQQGLELRKWESQIPKWSSGSFNSTMRGYVPSAERLFIVGSTAQALQGLGGGILAKLPVYLMGETGTGKNAMLRYLAHRTGTPLLRINFNRETDAAQLYGHFEIERDEQGRRRVVLRDGKMIQAMKHGAWVVWDEANLASESFLVAQNDLIQQIQTGKVTVRQGGKLVTIDVHTHFRLFATGNPEGYAGRKATERSFGNRWLKLFVKPMTVEEQQAFLATEYQDLSPESAEAIPSVLHALKVVLGGERVTLRTLKRVANRVVERERGGDVLWDAGEGRHGGLPLRLSASGMEVYVAALEAEVLDGLNPEDYEKAVQALAQALPRGSHAVSDYLNRPTETQAFFAEVENYRESLGEDTTKVPVADAHWEDLVPVPTTLKYASKVLDSFRRGDHILIEGPPALSKSAIPKWLGKLLQQPVIEVTGSPDHSASEMIGMPTLDEAGNLIFQEGYFLRAIQEGAIVVLNEANLIPAEVLERLNSVFDDDKMIVVSENGREAPVQAHPNFRLVLTQNPAGMNGGRKPHSPALENKFRKIFLRDAFSQEELTLIARESFPALAPAAEEMARFHQEAARIFAAEGENLTLRDLLHWGLIAVAFTQTETLPPHEALTLGAELTYLSRSADPELRENLKPSFDRLAADLEGKEFRKEDSPKGEHSETETADPLRQTIRGLLEDPEVTDVRKVYERLAPNDGMPLEYWLFCCLRALPKDECDEAEKKLKSFGVIERSGSRLSRLLRDWRRWVSSWTPPEMEQSDERLLGDHSLWNDEIKSLVRLKSPAASDRLLELLHDEYFGPDAAQALGRLGEVNENIRQALLERLRHPDFSMRMFVAEALGRLGFADESVLKGLRLALEDEDIQVRMDAALALGKVGHADDSVRQALLDILDLRGRQDDDLDPPVDEELALVWIAAEALVRWGLEDERVLQFLLQEPFEKEDVWFEEDYSFFHLALQFQDRFFPGWDRKMRSKYSTLEKILAEEMSASLADAQGAQKTKIESLLKVLPKWDVPNRGALDPMRQTLRRLLQNPELHDPAQLQVALAKESQVGLPLWMGYFLQDASQGELESFLDRLPENWKPWPEEWIGAMGLSQGLPYLLRSARIKGWDHLERRQAAIHALGQLGQNGPEVEAVLADGLRVAAIKSGAGMMQNLSDIHRLALRSTVRLRLKSPSIQAALEKLFAAPQSELRQEAAKAWADLQMPFPPSLAETLIERLTTRMGRVEERVDAALALGLLKHASAAEILRETMADPECLVGVAAAQALGQMGLHVEEARRHLRLRLGNISSDVRIAAVEALLALNWEGEDIEKALLATVKSRYVKERGAMIRALGHLQQPSPKVRPALLKALQKDRHIQVRLAAVAALGRGPEPAAEVEDFLEKVIREFPLPERMLAWEIIGALAWTSPKVEKILLEARQGFPWDRAEAAKGLVRLGIQSEAAKQALWEEIKDEQGIIAFAARDALNQLFPGWDMELKNGMPKIRRLIAEELSRPQTETLAAQGAELRRLESGLPKWSATNEGSARLLQEHIPGAERLFIVGSAAQALQSLVGGILARLPVYLMGETGTGKNAMLRYLAYRTGTPLLRINFNRETDASQLYGHFEIERDGQGKRRIVLRDGKMIQAMKHGAWVLWGEANLASEAFLVAQNDLIQQIQTGQVTVRQGGKLVTIDVHPHFRLFATGNPEGYAGRKATERSFGNRWLKLFVQPIPVEEQQAFLATEYKDLSPRSAEAIPSVLHALKIAIGGERVTLRTVKRVAHRIAEWEREGKALWDAESSLSALGMEAYVAAIEAEVLDSLAPEDYGKAVEVLAPALPRGNHAVSDYLNHPVKEKGFFAEVEEYRQSLQVKPLQQSAHWEDLVSVPTTLKYARKVLDSFRRGDAVLLEGPPALSKSAIPKWLGKLLNQAVIEVTGSPDHSASELIGMPTLDEAGNLVFQEGYFLRALKEGAILILNEANLIPAEVLERLNSVFDDDKMIVVSENSHEAPVKAHPNFRLILTQNPAGMNGGRRRHSPALENKFRKIFLRDAFSQEELAAIVGAALDRGQRPRPHQGSGGGGTSGDPEGFRNPQYRLSPTAHPLPARVSPAMGAARWFAAVAPPSVVLASVFERKGKARSPDAPQLPAPEQKRLEDKAVAATEEVQARIDAFMSEHGRTLENLGSLAAMKRVRVLVDLTGEVDLAALNLDIGEMRINPLAAQALSPGQLAALALHEGGHGAVSRVGDGFFFEKRSRQLLANCLEDPRVNEYALARLPGAREGFASLYEKFFPPTKADTAGKSSIVPPLGELPHEQFALGFLELWANGSVTGRIDLPEIRDALDSLEPVARRIWGTHPHLYHPQEKEVLAKQNEVYALIREKILPSYERFYQASLEVLEEWLRAGGMGEGRAARGIDAEDLSVEARELLERRAGRLAERLEPREASGRRREQVERSRSRGEGSGAGASPYREADFKPYGEKTVADLLKERGLRKANREAFYDNNPWRRYFDPVASVATEVAELLRQVLRLNADFDYQGHYVSGSRLDVRKAVETLVKNEAGLFSEEDLRLFLRKKFPTRRSHRFVLLLDESGSMKGEAQGSALEAVALFLYVLEGLRADHAVAGFSDTPNLHKDFQDQDKSEAAKNALMTEMESAGGGGTNDLAGLKLSAELLAGQDTEEETIIVVTDGEGVDTTADYVKELEAEGVKVIGIGVGAGTESVARVYGDHYQSPDFRDLPKTLLRILTGRMLK